MHRGGALTAWFPRRTRPAYLKSFNAGKTLIDVVRVTLKQQWDSRRCYCFCGEIQPYEESIEGPSQASQTYA